MVSVVLIRLSSITDVVRVPPVLSDPWSLFLQFPENKQTLAVDLLNPSIESEKKKHKLKRLVQSPNSYFMDVKCPGKPLDTPRLACIDANGARRLLGCFAITTVFSHAQTVVLCGSCSTVLCQPTGGKARLTEGEFDYSPPDNYFLTYNPPQDARSAKKYK